MSSTAARLSARVSASYMPYGVTLLGARTCPGALTGQQSCREVELAEDPHLEQGRARSLPDEGLAVVEARKNSEREPTYAGIQLQTERAGDLIQERDTLVPCRGASAVPLGGVRGYQ